MDDGGVDAGLLLTVHVVAYVGNAIGVIGGNLELGSSIVFILIFSHICIASLFSFRRVGFIRDELSTVQTVSTVL
jgi:hypothetical protein